MNEAIELAAALEHEAGVHLAAVIANRVLPELFARARRRSSASRRADSCAALALALGSSLASVEDVLAGARLAVRIRRQGAVHLERLRQAVAREAPILLLPFLFGRAHGPRAIHQVAALLSEELGL